MDWDNFKKELDAYVGDMHDAELADWTELGHDHFRIFVQDSDRNDYVWEMEYFEESGLCKMGTVVGSQGAPYECLVTCAPWAVGALLFS